MTQLYIFLLTLSECLVATLPDDMARVTTTLKHNLAKHPDSPVHCHYLKRSHVQSAHTIKCYATKRFAFDKNKNSSSTPLVTLYNVIEQI